LRLVSAMIVTRAEVGRWG